MYCKRKCTLQMESEINKGNLVSKNWIEFIRSEIAGPSGRSHADIVGSNPTGDMDVCLLWVLFMLSGRGLCDELITRPDESYRLRCVVVCDLETSWMRRPWPSGGLSRQKQTNKRRNLCALHKQSNATVLSFILVHRTNNYMFRPCMWAIFRL